MKIRNGFVSNSSSSSFIVCFPREPKNALDVKEMVFKEEEFVCDPCSDKQYETMKISENIWSDICQQTKNDYYSAKEEICSGHIDDADAPDFDNYSHIIDSRKRWDKYDYDIKIFANKKINELFNIRKIKLNKINNEDVENVVFYIFYYSDNDGDYFYTLEHDDIFKNLKHLRISKH